MTNEQGPQNKKKKKGLLGALVNIGKKLDAWDDELRKPQIEAGEKAKRLNEEEVRKAQQVGVNDNASRLEQDKWISFNIQLGVPENKVNQSKALLMELIDDGFKQQQFNGSELNALKPLDFEINIYTEKANPAKYQINQEINQNYYFVGIEPKGRVLSPKVAASNMQFLKRIAVFNLNGIIPKSTGNINIRLMQLHFSIKLAGDKPDGKKILVEDKNGLSVSGYLSLAIKLDEQNHALCKEIFWLTPTELYNDQRNVMSNKNQPEAEKDKAKRFIEAMIEDGFVPTPKVALLAKYQDGSLLLVQYKGREEWDIPTEEMMDGETGKEALNRLITKVEKLGFKISKVGDLRKDTAISTANYYMAEAKVTSNERP